PAQRPAGLFCAAFLVESSCFPPALIVVLLCKMGVLRCCHQYSPAAGGLSICTSLDLAAGAVFEPCIFLAGFSFFVAGYRSSMQKTCRFTGRRALWYPFAEKNTKMVRRKEPWIIATPP